MPQSEFTPASPKVPVIWIISTGTEILQGHYADANAQWISAHLLSLGFGAQRHMALPDQAGLLREGLGEAARQADLVITTGGLGPTGDDLNRQVIAQVWGTTLEEDAEAWERIKERFRKRGRVIVDSNRAQALIPRGSVILHNENGTAPGFYLKPSAEGLRATVIALPGPPREMRPMFANQAAPLILKQFGQTRARLRTLTFHTGGLPESAVNDLLADLFEHDSRVNFALLANLGRVDIRLTFMGPDETVNQALEEKWRATLYERIGSQYLYGEESVTLEEAVVNLLRQRGETLATAESCTGGLLAGRLTSISGSSDIFREGFVTYANEAKMSRLGVDVQLLVRHGAVSAEVAAAMAGGARRAAQTDWAISVTGIAGPTGGSPEKPVGLVFFGLADSNGNVRCVRHQFLGGREDVRAQAVQAALDLLRRGLIGAPLEGAVSFEAN